MLIGQRSRHRIPPFRLHCPIAEAEAVDIFNTAPGSTSYMSGGIDLVNRLKSGGGADNVIHLGRLPGRASIFLSNNALVVGAGVTHDALARDELVREHAPELAAKWASVANIRVRLKGTVGGNIMAKEVAYDFPVVALALGAIMEFAEDRSLAAYHDAHALGGMTSSRLLTRVHLPKIRMHSLAIELRWKPVVAFALSLRRDRQSAGRLRLAVGTGFSRLASSELDCGGEWTTRSDRERRREAAALLTAGLPEPLDDWRASAAYRRRLLSKLVERQLERPMFREV